VLAYEALRRASERPGAAPILARELCTHASRSHDGAAVGLILVRPDGEVAIVHASEHMSWALAVGDAPPTSGLRRDS
jgi:beta-aspartyl-peptidase (threonine type)